MRAFCDSSTLRISADGILSSILRLNVPALLAIAVLLTIGQLIQLSQFPPLSLVETVMVLCSIMCFSAVACALAALIGGTARSAAVWTLLLVASCIYLSDSFSYAWLSAHLDETVPLLIQNARTDFQVMRSKMAALLAAASALAMFAIFGTLAVAYGMRRFPSWSTPVALRRAVAFLAAAFFLLGVDRIVSPRVLTLPAYEAKNQVLWHPAFYTPPHPRARTAIFDIAAPKFRQVADEQAVAAAITGLNPGSVRRPFNVFVFIIDSLREDVIDETTAPNLFKLQQSSLPIGSGVASSNVTHISWFSLAHAVNPVYWSVAAHQAHSRGSVPMRMLAKCGYTLHALACPNLEYFGFERSVFGDNPRLPVTVMDQRTFHDPSTDGGEGDIDEKVMARLGREIASVKSDSRAFYLVMLDSTHHDYSWSKRYTPTFAPFTDHVSVLKTPKADITALTNRYKNAVAFVDMLMGEFLEKLQSNGLMDESIIVVTGDHGEEFLERGHLVHASELNRFQTRVPILIHVPPSAVPPGGAPSIPRASHIDVFPTVFDALGLDTVRTDATLDGRSLLRRDGAPVEFCAMSSSFSPERLMFDAGDYKLIVELQGIRKVGRTLYARRLLASKVLNANDEEVTPGANATPGIGELRTLFQPALDRMLSRE